MLDAKRAVYWLHEQGYERIGILGTSLGSCLAMLTAAHEPLVRPPRSTTCRRIRRRRLARALDPARARRARGHDRLPPLRRIWTPISPEAFIDRLRGKHVLLVYAQYDLTFPLDLSKELIDEFHDAA